MKITSYITCIFFLFFSLSSEALDINCDLLLQPEDIGRTCGASTKKNVSGAENTRNNFACYRKFSTHYNNALSLYISNGRNVNFLWDGDRLKQKSGYESISSLGNNAYQLSESKNTVGNSYKISFRYQGVIATLHYIHSKPEKPFCTQNNIHSLAHLIHQRLTSLLN